MVSKLVSGRPRLLGGHIGLYHPNKDKGPLVKGPVMQLSGRPTVNGQRPRVRVGAYKRTWLGG